MKIMRYLENYLTKEKHKRRNYWITYTLIFFIMLCFGVCETFSVK